jgi:hypothetical protein
MQMIDDPVKTRHLLENLWANLPFEVRLSPTLVGLLRARSLAVVATTSHLVRKISYLGDEGGIVCHLDPGEGQEAIVASLTHLDVPVTVPMAAAVAVYQKRRIKRLKKLNRT